MSFAILANQYPKMDPQFLELGVTLSILHTRTDNLTTHLDNEINFRAFYDQSDLKKLEANEQYEMSMHRQAFLVWYYTLDEQQARIKFREYRSRFRSERLGTNWIALILEAFSFISYE